MLNQLQEWDKYLAVLWNSQDLPHLVEGFLVLSRNKFFWIPLYLFLIFLLVKRYGKNVWIFLLGIVTCVLAADTLSSKILKPLIGRIRPCRVFSEEIISRVDCGSGFSFPSSHATNHFAIAVLLIVFFKPLSLRWKLVLVSWAALVALAQVFVGVHFPLDVLGGSLIGALIGWVIGESTQYIYKTRIT